MEMVESWWNSIIFGPRISETSLDIDELTAMMFRWVRVAFCYSDGQKLIVVILTGVGLAIYLGSYRSHGMPWLITTIEVE